MKNKHGLIIFSSVLVSLLSPLPGRCMELLSDQKLNAVTAGGTNAASQADVTLTRIPFHYTSGKGQVDGEVIVVPRTSINQAATLQLMDNAQSNLRSLINVNAVNSPIQILLNLNINVNSNINNLNQWNQLMSTIGTGK